MVGAAIAAQVDLRLCGGYPTMRVGLLDGSDQHVITNHPFYVDGGPGADLPSWVQAGDHDFFSGCKCIA